MGESAEGNELVLDATNLQESDNTGYTIKVPEWVNALFYLTLGASIYFIGLALFLGFGR